MSDEQIWDDRDARHTQNERFEYIHVRQYAQLLKLMNIWRRLAWSMMVLAAVGLIAFLYEFSQVNK